MGRARLPVEEQKKHLTIAEKQQRQMEQEKASAGRDRLRLTPKTKKLLMNEEAIQKYREVLEMIEDLDFICDLDRDNLVGYCNAWTCVQTIAREMGRNPELILDKDTVQIYRGHCDEMRRFGRLCGMTLDSRLKAASLAVKKEQDEISDKFGIF
jgi:phage terminase small subunit